jgi:hypothetical protein
MKSIQKTVPCRLCSKPVQLPLRWCPPVGLEPGCGVLECLYKLMDEGREEPGEKEEDPEEG